MAGFKLVARARLSIELALAAGRGDPILPDSRNGREGARRYGG